MTAIILANGQRILNDLTGRVFGRLTVLTVDKEATTRATRWICQCVCGSRVIVFGGNITRGHSKSCGCLRADVTRMNHTTHGESKRGQWSAEYRTLVSIKERCLRPSHDKYKYYGGRGIRVCDRWLESFENFLADMGRKPSPKHSIDRIDNDGDYEPSNCRWATIEQQATNRRCAVMLTCNGIIRSQAEWARIYGITDSRIHTRIKRGWSVERAITTPVR